MDNVMHFEVPVDDFDRAKKFYTEIFGWRMEDQKGMEYTIAQTVEMDKDRMPVKPGAINGGFMKRSGEFTGPSFAINVKNIDDTVKKIKSAGGEIVREKTPVGDMGFVAYFKDTEGNLLSVWENAR